MRREAMAGAGAGRWRLAGWMGGVRAAGYRTRLADHAERRRPALAAFARARAAELGDSTDAP